MTTGWEWPASRVTRVIDGDTVDAVVTRDLGFGGTSTFTVRLRLNRVNAPALHSTKGAAAKAWLSPIVLDPPALHITTLKAYKYGGPDTSPGEWMAEITLPDGTNVSDELVAHQFATYWDGVGARPNEEGT